MQHWTAEWFRGSVLRALFTLLAVWDGGVKEQCIVYDAHALSFEELNTGLDGWRCRWESRIQLRAMDWLR
eukprot:2627287-Prymnesium_polylepis.1